MSRKNCGSCPVAGRVSITAANRGHKPRIRGICFAVGSENHVHFGEKLHDAVAMVTQESGSSFPVKVGFLVTRHRYEITICLLPVRRLSEGICEAPVHGLFCKLLSVYLRQVTASGVEYSAHKEVSSKRRCYWPARGHWQHLAHQD